MKILSLFLLIVLLSINVMAQEIPNGNFEDWIKTSNYEDPQSWTTPNMLLAALSVSTVKKEFTNVQSGLYSARLENIEILGGMYRVPGFMTLGMFTFDPSTFESEIFGGIPYTNRPKKFKGYYHYSPAVTGDTGLIGIVFFVYDTVLQKKDTIGGGKLFISQPTNGWQKFEINIDYKNTDLPDSMNIVFLSSQRFDPPVGTVLLVDSLYFDHLGNIEDPVGNRISYTVFNGKILIQSNLDKPAEWKWWDINGKCLFSGKTKPHENIIIPFSRNGVFILTLSNENLNVTKKILITE